ncbi:unnamed protein product [Mesocestoides corti]|uniref:DNA helicase n=1 Tax=Mesocestoides corti TaxID=53468 RepID=A0A0R3UL53_MESCO|nr:unnamed protein product [Mesocestoides corti]
MPNLFESAERLYKRFSGGQHKSNAPNTPSKYTRKADARSNDGATVSPAVSSGSPLQWVAQKNYSARANSSSNLAISTGTEMREGDRAPIASPRAPLPPGDLTAVSSESDSDYEPAFEGLPSTAVDGAPVGSRANHRLRQSLQRAKAAAFETQMSVSGDSQNRYPSAERLYTQVAESFDDEDGEDEEEESDKESDEKAVERTGQEEEAVVGLEQNAETDSASSVARAYKASLSLHPRAGVRWPSDPPQPLVDILPKIRRCLGPPNTEFVRAICQRPSCRCLLRGHDTLMLFPVFDAVLCEATWEKIKDSQFSSRSGSHFLSRLQHGHATGPTSETQANLILFRQCRGWYEVMNENYEPVPHWTTIEEVRCAKPATFLVRRDLKCLLAPTELWVPPQLLSSTDRSNSGAPPIPIPSSIVVEAANPKTIASSSVFVLKPGTLLSYVDYIHDCTVSRGKKFKLMSFVLAVEKCRSQRQGDTPNSPRRLFYIGTEEASSQAVFPAKVALSPIAGPENISGVHTLSSLLRKFRLPLSIVPVAVPERKMQASASSLSSLSNESGSTNYATAQSTKPVNIFPTVPGITFTDRTYIRLRGLLRGDVIIVAPVDSPDRFFLITPTLLQDHLFQVGFTEDAIYQRLAAGHRNRTLNFLSMAHPRDSLDYLLAFLKNITNKPRLMTNTANGQDVARSLMGRLTAGLMQNYEITSAMAKAIYTETGKDPRTGPESDMTPEQVDQAYDEMDDLYFFTRNGYYPAKTRQRRSKSTAGAAPAGMVNSNGNQVCLGADGGVPVVPRHPIPSAEQLLAATLNISTYK